MSKIYQYSAPGSTMLMGEHAVLRDKLAIVSAVNKRVIITLTPQNNQQIDIYSAIGTYHAPVDQLSDSPIFRFVLAAIKFYQAKIVSGFRLDIQAEFSSSVGLGSSAAVVVATLACLNHWLDASKENDTDLYPIFFDARAIIQQVQGRGSGADVAASVFGGVVAYRMHPLFIEKSENIFDIALLYTGYKTPTPTVITLVDQRLQLDPEKYSKIFDRMDTYSEQAWHAIQKKDCATLAIMMQKHQLAQTQLGVCDEKTAELLALLQKNDKVLSCKISGSGLGDCVVALITPNFCWQDSQFSIIDATLSAQGVTCGSL